MALTRKTVVVRAVQLCIALVVIGTAFRALHGQWGEARAVARGIRPDWALVAVASAVVLATYLVLAGAWRFVVNGMGGTLRYADAAYIWFVSALARYAGALWQVVAMSALSQRLGAPPLTSAGAAVVMTIVNVLTGIGIVLATLPAASEALGRNAYLATAAGVLALIAAPLVAPPLGRLASRLTGRAIALPNLTMRAVWAAALGSVVSWLCYGYAFYLLTGAVLGEAPGGWAVYVSIYTAAYIVGLLALVPAGVGVAEGAMVQAFALAGVLTPPQALTVALVSRLWRTVMEILPGVALILLRGGPRAALTAGSRKPEP